MRGCECASASLTADHVIHWALLIWWVKIMHISNNSGTCWFPILEACWFGRKGDQSVRMMWLMAIVATVIPYYRWHAQRWRQGLVVPQTYMNDSNDYIWHWGTCRQYHDIKPTLYVGKNRQTVSSLPLPQWPLSLPSPVIKCALRWFGRCQDPTVMIQNAPRW